GSDVDWQVRGRLYGIDHGYSARCLAGSHDAGDVVDRAENIAGMIAGDQPRARAHELIQHVVAIFEGFRIEIEPPYRDATLLRGDQPGTDIAVMVHACQHDLVAGLPFPRKHAREVENQ